MTLIFILIARAEDPNSGSCQFYITLRETPHLDGNYTVFGKVIKGMDVVKKLRKGDIIEKIEIIEGKNNGEFWNNCSWGCRKT